MKPIERVRQQQKLAIYNREIHRTLARLDELERENAASAGRIGKLFSVLLVAFVAMLVLRWPR